MYCKHCGKIIESDSKFCQHCGKSQDSSGNSLSNKPIWIIYLIWAISNLYLLMGEKDNEASLYFFPCIFDNDDYLLWNKEFYDFSDFIIYVFLLPFICYVLWIIYRKFTDKINNIIRQLLKK